MRLAEAAVNSGIVEPRRSKAVCAASTTTLELLLVCRLPPSAVRKSTGRSVTPGCGLGLTGNADELAASVIDELGKLSTTESTAAERHLSLRGPLSCCTAARTQITGIYTIVSVNK